MDVEQPVTPFAAAGGGEGLLALAEAWHVRCLADAEAAHPFEQGTHPQHLERLAAYWGEALGGPATYSHTMADESHVRRLHACDGPHPSLDAAAVRCFDAAMSDVGITGALRTTLHDYFAAATERMTGQPISADDIPDGLTVPQWSWSGPID